MTDGEVIRIPGARPVIRTKPDIRSKEQGWNSRFVLGSIPTYDAVRDRHCVVLTVTARKKKAAVTPIREQETTTCSESPNPRSTKTVSASPIVSILRNSPKDSLHDQLTNELMTEWVKEGIPEEIFSVMLRAIQAGTQKARIPTLTKELEYLKNKKSPVKKLFDTIMARENSILRLKAWGERLNCSSLAAEEAEKIHEDLLQHRVLTLDAVEAIASYRKHIHAVTQCDRRLYRAPVTYEGVNYLLKLKTDTAFLANSALSSLYEFSRKSDPFFIVPATQWNKNDKRELPFPGVLGGKVTRAENILLEETYSINEQRKASNECRRTTLRRFDETNCKSEEAAQLETEKLLLITAQASERVHTNEEPEEEAQIREKMQETPIEKTVPVLITDGLKEAESGGISDRRGRSDSGEAVDARGKEAAISQAGDMAVKDKKELGEELGSVSNPEHIIVPALQPSYEESNSASDNPEPDMPQAELSQAAISLQPELQVAESQPLQVEKLESEAGKQPSEAESFEKDDSTKMKVIIFAPELVEAPKPAITEVPIPESAKEELEATKLEDAQQLQSAELPQSVSAKSPTRVTRLKPAAISKSTDKSKPKSSLLPTPPKVPAPERTESIVPLPTRGKPIRTPSTELATTSLQDRPSSTLNDSEPCLPVINPGYFPSVSLRADSAMGLLPDTLVPQTSNAHSPMLPSLSPSPRKPIPPSMRQSRSIQKRPHKLAQQPLKPIPPISPSPAKRGGRSLSSIKQSSPAMSDIKGERWGEESKAEEVKREEIKEESPKAFRPQKLPSSETFKKPNPVIKKALALSVSTAQAKPEPIKEPPKEVRTEPPKTVKKEPPKIVKRDIQPKPADKPKAESKPQPTHKQTKSTPIANSKPTPVPEVPIEQPIAEPRTEPLPTAGIIKSDISIETFHLYADELRSKVERYVAQVPTDMQESFWHEGAFDALMKKSYPAIMSLNVDERRMGLLGLSIDTLSTKVHRVIISHISAGSSEDLKVVLERCLEFIWEAYPCDEIRIGLNYRLIDGVLQADPDLMSLLTSLKFRWRSLSISQDGRKTMILTTKRPEEAPEKPFSTLPLFRENFILKYGLAVQVGEGVRSDRQEGLFSLIGPIVCAKELGGVGLDGGEMSRNETLIASLVAKLPSNFIFPATRVKRSSVVSEALEEIKKQGLEMGGLDKEQETVGVCCCVGLRFPSFDTCLRPTRLGLTEYMRIYEATINHTSLDSRSIYFVPSDDKPYVLMLITLTPSDTEVNAFQLATDIVIKLTNDHKSCADTVSEIWLPGFTVTNKRVLGRFVGVKTARGTIETCAESYDVSLSVPIHNIGNIAMKPKQGVVVIEDSFVLGKIYAALLNRKLDDLCPIPYCALLVRKEQFNVQEKSFGEDD